MAKLKTSYWVIEHIPTGTFMPEVHSGYSHWKPWEFPCEDSRDSHVIRLFDKFVSAKTALTWYLKGEFYWKSIDPQCPYEGRDRKDWRKTEHHNPEYFKIRKLTTVLEKDV